MLSAARRNQQIEWHQGSAVELPFVDGSFDVVLCQQGLQYFPDPCGSCSRDGARARSRGKDRAKRVGRDGATAVLCCAGRWHRAVSPGEDARAGFDLAFSLNTAQELRTLAEEAGLKDGRVRFEHRTTRYPSPAAFVAGLIGGTPVTGQFLALPHERQEAFVLHVVKRRLAGYVDDGGLAFPQENHFLTGAAHQVPQRHGGPDGHCDAPMRLERVIGSVGRDYASGVLDPEFRCECCFRVARSPVA